jgi:arginine/lysine/histidine transporter system substrate-binding protein
MNRRQSLFAIAFASSLAISTMVGCGEQSNTSTPTAGSGKEVLTLITSPDYPPYEFYDTSTGKKEIVGFDIDIAKNIASELGLELKIVESDFNGLIPALQAKRADFVMAGMTPTDERKKNVDFSTIYYEAKDTILAPKASKLIKPEDLAGKKVGVQLGSIQETDLKDITKKVKGIQIVALNKIPEIIQEIKSKRLDAALIEDTVAQGFKDGNPELDFNVITTDGPSGAAIAFPQGSTRVESFNKVLAKMKASGELKTLAKKWFEKK